MARRGRYAAILTPGPFPKDRGPAASNPSTTVKALFSALAAASALLFSSQAHADPAAYDLAADLRARTALAREELGVRVHTATAGDVFLLVGDPTAAAVVERALPA